MKIYNIIEAINSPIGTKFKCTNNRIFEVREKELTDEFGNILPVTKEIINLEFTIVPKEVSFIEAVKAFQDEKEIKCELNGIEFKYVNKTNDTFIDENGEPISAGEILNGKFYILD